MRTPLAVAAALLVTLSAGCAQAPAGPAASNSSASSSPANSPSKRPSDSATPPVAKGSGPAGSIATTGSEAVALTFDDGPWPEYTPRMLDLLKANGVKATFCVIGKQALAYPDLIRRINDEGHTFCNHSWRHDLNLSTRGEAAIRDDLNATTRAIHDAAPTARIGYFRAPGGNYTPELVAIAASMSMTSLYWSVDPRDWEYSRYGYGDSMVRNIISNVETNTRRGSIVLSHDKAKPDTVTAYQTLLPWLNQSFQLIALPPDGRLPRP